MRLHASAQYATTVFRPQVMVALQYTWGHLTPMLPATMGVKYPYATTVFLFGFTNHLVLCMCTILLLQGPANLHVATLCSRHVL